MPKRILYTLLILILLQFLLKTRKKLNNNFEIWNGLFFFNPQIKKLNNIKHPIFSGFNTFDKIGPKYQKAIFTIFESLSNLLIINFKVVLKTLNENLA